MTLNRRCVIAAGLLSLAALAHAQDSGPTKMIVPFGPGTTTDTVGRVVAEALGKQLNQTVIVDNRAGAGGSVGSDQVAKSAPDGKTLVMGTVGTHAINAALFRKLPYDTLRDFAPVAFIGSAPTLLVVATNSPAKSLKDLAAMAARPEGVSFASAGNGTSGHLAGELRALAASGALRSAAASDVQTPMEQGVQAFDLVAWFMLYAAEEMLPFNKTEFVKWAELVKRSGAQVD